MKWNLSWPVLLLIVLLITSPARASSDTQLELKVLPMDCIFEIVDDGTGEIIYLTPEECEQFIDPPPDSSPPPSGDDSDASDPGTDATAPDYYYEVPFVGTDSNDSDSNEDLSSDDTSEDDSQDTPTSARDDNVPPEAQESETDSLKLSLIIVLKILLLYLAVIAWRKGRR